MRKLKNNPYELGFLVECFGKTFICLDDGKWYFATPSIKSIGNQVNLELQEDLDEAYEDYASQFQAIVHRG